MNWDSSKLASLRAWLKTQVSTDRYRHSLGVADAAVRLAKRYGVSTAKAEAAAYFHDCAKDLSASGLVKWLRGTPFRLDPGEKKIPALWHCAAGAATAWKTWKVRDRGLLEAVRWHSLGGPQMDRLAQVLFVADYIEGGRRFEGVGKARRAVYRDLRWGVRVKCEGTLTYLLRHDLAVHPRLIATWNAFLSPMNRT